MGCSHAAGALIGRSCDPPTSSGITPPFGGLFLSTGHITQSLLTRSPLAYASVTQCISPFDLHALATPPAFVLSQDQTLQLLYSLALRKQVHAPAPAADEQGLIQTHQPSIPAGDRKLSRVRMHERTGIVAPVTHQISAACGPRGPAPASHSHGSSTVHLPKSVGTSAAPYPAP